jgi:hypothetical protein
MDWGAIVVLGVVYGIPTAVLFLMAVAWLVSN